MQPVKIYGVLLCGFACNILWAVLKDGDVIFGMWIGSMVIQKIFFKQEFFLSRGFES